MKEEREPARKLARKGRAGFFERNRVMQRQGPSFGIKRIMRLWHTLALRLRL